MVLVIKPQKLIINVLVIEPCFVIYEQCKWLGISVYCHTVCTLTNPMQLS